ncbi:hypothetical protein H4Q26_015285 [Puccinia striiformis f. sp. tritici PST-130]|nr:hypothetical protein H4Q26_015285 [Puccinia striiformis f. sp. tritici PST-130]
MSAPTPRRTPTPTTKSKSKPATGLRKLLRRINLCPYQPGADTLVPYWLEFHRNNVKSLKALVCSQDDGRPCWNEFILGQAIDIVKREEPPRGTYPGGSYINSSKLKSEFLPMGRGFCVTRHSRMACLSYTNFWKQNWE